MNIFRASPYEGGFAHVRTPAGGHEIFSRVWDDRTRPVPAIVLVHGVIASSRYMMPLAACLRHSYRVYVPDLPGYGLSSRPSRALPVPELADALAAWMPAVGLESAVFVGNSFGCQIIADLALRFPELVDRAVLAGSTVDTSARSALRLGVRLALDAPREHLSLWPIQFGDLFRMGTARASLQVRYMVQDRIEQKLPRLRVPVLVVRGDRDPIAPQRWVEEMVRLLPHGTLVTIPNSPHCSNFSTPQALADVVDAFVKRKL